MEIFIAGPDLDVMEATVRDGVDVDLDVWQVEEARLHDIKIGATVETPTAVFTTMGASFSLSVPTMLLARLSPPTTPSESMARRSPPTTPGEFLGARAGGLGGAAQIRE